MKHVDLFSGIGGFAYAAREVWKSDYKNICFCEIDGFCQKVLRKNFGNDINLIENIFDLKGDNFGTVDLLSGGFPCQPFSIAGKRKGKNDDRFLWDEMFRVIREIKPRWIIGENVANLWNMGLDKMLSQVEGEGYEVETFIIPACAVNAPHRRDRVWIIAYSNTERWMERRTKIKSAERNKAFARSSVCDKVVASSNSTRRIENRIEQSKNPEREIFERCREDKSFSKSEISNYNSTNAKGEGLQGGATIGYLGKERVLSEAWDYIGIRHVNRDWQQSWYEVATEFCRVDDGIPHRVDRLKSLGNAIVPQVAMLLMDAIKEIDKQELNIEL